jgi:hypothetical protein
VLVLIMTVAIAALVASAIYLTSGATVLSHQYDREREFRYASEAALQMGKSYLNNSAYALPDTGYVQTLSNATILDANNKPIPGVSVNLYLGPTGTTTGQFGRFASLVSEARDASGARYVRRLELAQESFAKFAYWTNRETSGSGVIYFASQDNLWGPVWSNDDIHIHSTGARFHDDVGTAGKVIDPQYAVFDKGYQEKMKPIQLPTNTALSKLAGYAQAGNFRFTAPTSGDVSTTRMRIEFVAVDLDDPDTDSTGTGEGFFRVYVAKSGEEAWLRGDYRSENCGDWHDVNPSGSITDLKFFPHAIHDAAPSWFKNILTGANGMSSTQANNHMNLSLKYVMGMPNARCYPGGDPHLVAVERNTSAFSSAEKQKGGDDTTFTANGKYGSWVPWPGVVQPTLNRPDRNYLFPLYRGYNPTTQGVIYIAGTVGVSGVLRGEVTLYASGEVALLDDLKYANDPALGRCRDILGIIAGQNAVVLDNALNTPQVARIGGSDRYHSMDETPDVFLHSVIMALQHSFTAENYSSGPTSGGSCGGTSNGRNCLYVTGGLIQDRRGPVGLTNGAGFIKRYSYDRCALYNPPPYFPTTGRFIDNRYYEIDPVSFTVDELFARLTVNP